MVEYETDKVDRSDLCDMITGQEMDTLAEMARLTEQSGNEQAIAIAQKEEEMRSTDITEGESGGIYESQIASLRIESMGLFEQRNTIDGRLHYVHTHPSGDSSLSFEDLIFLLDELDKGVPMESIFAVSKTNEGFELNGVEMPTEFDMERAIGIRKEIQGFKQMIDEGSISRKDGRQISREKLDSIGCKFCHKEVEYQW